MRRREKGLGFWLETAGRGSTRKGIGPGAQIRFWLGLRGARRPVVGVPLALGTAVQPFSGPLIGRARVVEGLDFLSCVAPEHPGNGPCPAVRDRDGVLRRMPRVIQLPLPKANCPIRDHKVISLPRVRSKSVGKPGLEPRVFALRLLEHAAAQEMRAWLTPSKMQVASGTDKIRKIPHRRDSVDLKSLGVQESERLTREAESLRGLDPGRAELLGVFPSVPVEIISRMHLARRSMKLLFTVVWQPALTRTRVHDMIAVRDRVTDETWVVPHRTRYRMAFLS